MFRLAFLTTAVLWFFAAAAMAADRAAVIAAGGGDAAGFAPLIEADLQRRGLQLVERDALGKVLKEQELDAALTAEGAADRVKLGRILKADFLVFVRCPERPAPRLEVTVCETTQGIRLANRLLPRTGDAGKDAAAAEEAAAGAVAKAKKPDLTIVAVAPWDTDDFTTRFDYHRLALRQIAEQTLIGCDDVVLVEFKEAQALATELALSGQAALERKRPLMLSGRVAHSSMKEDADVTLRLELTRGDEKLGAWDSGQMPPGRVAQALPGETLRLVEKARGKNVAAAPKAQAAELAERGRRLFALSFFPDALEVLEAALLLDPENVSLHSGAFRAIGLQISRDEAAAVAAAGRDEEEHEVLRKFSETVDPRVCSRGLAHFEFYLTRTKLSLRQVFDDVADAEWLIRMAPPKELREANYRALKYRHDHRVKDEFAQMFRQEMNRENYFGRFPKPTEDEVTDIAVRMADVWISANQDWDVRTMLGGVGVKGAPSGLSPQQERIVAAMERSPNPEARQGAAKIRAEYARKDSGASTGPASRPAPVARRTDPPKPDDASLARIRMPVTEQPDTQGWVPAGPHADLFHGRPATNAGRSDEPHVLYYFRDDGWSRELPRCAVGSGPAFDGRYAWFVGSENGTAAVYAYDPSADKLWVAQVGQGVPPDVVYEAWLVPLSPGSVCIAAAVGESPERTWVALARLDATKGPECKILLQCRERAPNLNGNMPITCAFRPGFAFLLPGPPGAREKATPHVYFGRQMRKTLMVDPAAGTCSLTDFKGLDERSLLWPERPYAAVWENKLYSSTRFYGFRAWDPASNTVAALPQPAGLDPRPACFSIAFYGGNCYLFDSVHLYAGPPGEKLNRLLEIDGTSSGTELATSSLFGVILRDGRQARLLPPAPGGAAPAAPDFGAWFRNHLSVCPDAGGFQMLAEDIYAKSGPCEEWVKAMDEWLKYRPRSLEYAQSEVSVADYLMSKGAYARARKYADDAATSGAEWATQCAGYVAEGLGDWARAESIAKEAAGAYGQAGGWFQWCCRTGHGDIAAARAQAVRSLDESADDREVLADAAAFYLLSGDKAKAGPILRRLAGQKRDVWAALNAAVLAAEDGHPAERDEALAAVAGNHRYVGARQLHTLAELVADSLEAGGKLDLQKVDALMAYPEHPTEKANVSYFAGRFLLLAGDRDAGLRYLRLAAGLNTSKTARALAAQQLRSLGVEVPKPGQTQ